MAVTDEQSLRQRRESIVREHVAAENRQDVEATISTFDRPRYEVNGEAHDGESAVRDLLQGMLGGFPDFHAEVLNMRHAEDAIVGEARITGTHNGAFAGIPPTGRKVDYAMATIFEFEGDRLVCEKVYFDLATLLGQIGVLPNMSEQGAAPAQPSP
jgi:steroid delta-isomerase-like uncharacterized protein